MIVERPIPSHLVNEIDALAHLVVVRHCSSGLQSANSRSLGWEEGCRATCPTAGLEKALLRNYSVGENATSGSSAADKTVLALHSELDNRGAAREPGPSNRPSLFADFHWRRRTCWDQKCPPLGRPWARAPTRARSLDLPRALIISKPKQFIFPERAADSVAKLIAAQFRFCRIEKIARIEFVVAEKFEDIAMKAVCAGFRDRVHDAAAELAVFGIEAVGDQAEFLNGIQVRNQSRPLFLPSLTSPPFTRKAFAVSRWPLTDIFPTFVKYAGDRPILLNRSGSDWRNTGLQTQQIDEATAIQAEAKVFAWCRPLGQVACCPSQPGPC